MKTTGLKKNTLVPVIKVRIIAKKKKSSDKGKITTMKITPLIKDQGKGEKRNHKS